MCQFQKVSTQVFLIIKDSVLTNPNGIVSPLDTTVDESGEETPRESGVFKMKDLEKGFSSFTSEKKDNIYIRNILVNAQWFMINT